ncbi:MAG: carbohydrate kinase family protein [Gemmatimonadetes bacterium]|nr:carbohydrate kinase family protein [Gemmatimonadota bacterium]
MNEDTIVQADGRTTHDLGGVLFTAGALARMGKAIGLEPWLVTRVGEAQRARIEKEAVRLQGLRFDTMLSVPGAGYRCNIRYAADGTKSEVLEGHVPALSIRDLAPCLRTMQGLVVNFITGFEMDLSTLQAARRIVCGPILMDLHSLTLSRNAQGQRQPRRLPRWRAWFGCADIVQMNQSEAQLLGAGPDVEGAMRFARTALAWGPRAVVVTLSTAGAIAAWREEGEQIHTTHEPAYPIDAETVDTTGCGDVFLAGLSARLLTGGDVPSALRWGARAAAEKCSQPGLSGLDCVAPESMFLNEV